MRTKTTISCGSLNGILLVYNLWSVLMRGRGEIIGRNRKHRRDKANTYSYRPGIIAFLSS